MRWAAHKINEIRKNENGKKKTQQKKDNISLDSKKDTFTAFTETIEQHRNFLREGGGGCSIGWGGVRGWQLLDSLSEGGGG